MTRCRCSSGSMPPPPRRQRSSRPRRRSCWSGDPARALELGEGSSQLARHMSAHDQMHATSVIMTAADWLGDWDRVESALAEHLANFDQEANVHCLNVQSGPNRGALVVARRGDPARARGLAERTIPFELDAWPDPVHRGRCARRGGRRGSRAENRRGRDGARAAVAPAGGCCGSDPRSWKRSKTGRPWASWPPIWMTCAWRARTWTGTWIGLGAGAWWPPGARTKVSLRCGGRSRRSMASRSCSRPLEPARHWPTHSPGSAPSCSAPRWRPTSAWAPRPTPNGCGASWRPVGGLCRIGRPVPRSAAACDFRTSRSTSWSSRTCRSRSTSSRSATGC